MEVEPRSIYKTPKITEQARKKFKQATDKGELVDYLSFVPDGEPTLDADLGREIEVLKTLAVRVAVVTNGSLLWREDVRQNLRKADWVSLKVDAVSEAIWHTINRPQKSLKLKAVLQGMTEFSQMFDGELATETMLVKGVNDDLDEAKKIAEFLAVLKPTKVYVAVPTRPPAERVMPATEQTVNATYQIFAEKLSGVEYLVGYEGNAFAGTGNVQEDLLSITAVHPMREEAVIELLSRSNANWESAQDLIERRMLVEMEYQGKKFYMRKLQQQ
jgi:wyosine [tRNA(Phe)-imidazoG37] synthetase (radical SAM superfamily)